MANTDAEMIAELFKIIAVAAVPEIAGPAAAVSAGLKMISENVLTASTEVQFFVNETHNMVEAGNNTIAAFSSIPYYIDLQAKTANNLIAQYENLQASGSKTIEQQNDIRRIVDELNQRYPNLGLAIMDVDGNLNKSIDTVKRYVNGKKEESELMYEETGNQEYLNYLNQWANDLEMEKMETLSALGITMEGLGEEEYKRILNNESLVGLLTTKHTTNLQETADTAALQEELKEIYGTSRFVYEEIDRVSTSMDNNSVSTANNTEEAKAWNENLGVIANEGLSGFVKSIQEKGPEAGSALVEMAQYMQENGDIAFAQLYDAMQGSAAEGISAMESELLTEDATGMGGQLIDSNAEAVAENTLLMQSAMDQVTNTKALMLAQVALSDFPAVGKTMIALVMMGAVLTTFELNSCVKGIIGIAKAAMLEQVALSDFPSIGKSMIEGAIQGLNAKAPEMYAQARRIANTVAATLRSAFQVNSPSKVVSRIFESVGEGAILGLDSKVEAVKNKSGEMAGASIDALAGGLYPGVASTMSMATNNQNIGPIVIQQPVKTPAETARAIKREMVMLLG